MHEQHQGVWYPLLDVTDGRTPIGGVKCVVYCLQCLDSSHEYVGQTKGFFQKRLKWHILDAFKRKRQSEFTLARALRKHGLDRFVVCILEVVADASLLNDVEKHHVAVRGTYSSGYNMTLGGDGFSSRPLPERAKARLRKPVQQLDATTGDVIAEFGSVSEAMSATGITNITYACQGRLDTAGGYRFRFVNPDDRDRGRWSEAAIEASKLRPPRGVFVWKSVEQYDLETGRSIAVFSSMKEAVAATGVLNVSMVCRGVRKSAGGFGWRYAEVTKTVPELDDVRSVTLEHAEVLKKHHPRPRHEAKPKEHKRPRWKCPSCDLDFGQPNVFHRHLVESHGYDRTPEDLYCEAKGIVKPFCACGCGRHVAWYGWTLGYSLPRLPGH